jgi:hypothetical protein
VVEVEVAPSVGGGKTLGVLDGRVGAVKRSGEIAPARRFGSRTIGVFRRESQLQFLEKDRPFRKLTCLLVDLVRPGSM